MGKNSYKAQLNYYDSKWGWKSEGTASQGQWDGTGVRTGVLYFPGLAALKGKIINSIKLTATTGQTGYGTATTKTVYIYNSASQGGIKTSLNAGHRTGNALGSCKAPMWDNTKTFDVAFMAASIAAGYDTYCIYNGSSYTDYLKWTAVTLEVDWQEPATQPSLSAATVEMGKSVTINTPAVNSAYRHTLRYAFGGASGTIATGIASSVSWTPPVSLANQIPSATAGSGTIYCDTYSGSTLLGTKSVSITLTVPGSVVPSAGTLSAALAEDTSGTGLYVKGMGKAKLTLSGASGAYGSSITSYTITGGGWTATNGALTTGTLASAGNITFTATVTDSRGRKASTTRTISVIDYTKPGVAVCDVYRCDADGNRKKAGTYFAVEINASYSAITGNTLSITARYKKQSESSYGTAANVTNNGKTVIGGGNIGASTTYDVLVTVADKYNSLPILRTLSTKSVLQSFKRSAGAAIGKVAELSGWLDIAWHTRIRGNLQVDGTISTIIPITSGGTGATNRGDALNNLVTGDPYYGNLNDLKTAGEYWVDLSNCQNGPVGSGYGSMEVTRSTTYNYFQRFTFYDGMVYYRTFVNGQWYDWRALPNAHATETLWEGSFKSGAATISNGAKYAYLIVAGMAGANSNWVTQIIPNGWGAHMELTNQDHWLAYKTEISGDDTILTILDNRYSGWIQWVYGVNKYQG